MLDELTLRGSPATMGQFHAFGLSPNLRSVTIIAGAGARTTQARATNEIEQSGGRTIGKLWGISRFA